MPSTIGIVASHYTVGGLTPGTWTLNPTVNTGNILSYDGTGSGYTYADTRAGFADFLVNSGGIVGQVTDGAGYYECDLWYAEFDTLIASGTLSSVTMKLWVQSDFSATDFTIECWQDQDYGTSLTSADWIPGASMNAVNLGARRASLSTAGLTVGALNTMTNDATNLKDNLVTTGAGKSRYVFSSSRFSSGTTPTGNEYIGLIPNSCRLVVVVV